MKGKEKSTAPGVEDRERKTVVMNWRRFVGRSVFEGKVTFLPHQREKTVVRSSYRREEHVVVTVEGAKDDKILRAVKEALWKENRRRRHCGETQFSYEVKNSEC